MGLKTNVVRSTLWRGNEDEVEIEIRFGGGGTYLYAGAPFDPRAEDPRQFTGSKFLLMRP